MHRLYGLLYYAGLVLAVLVIVFLIFSALPADPARLMLGPNATEQAVISLRQELGLDRPLATRFASYVADLARLELGTSFVTRRPVAPDVAVAAGATLTYVVWALLLALLYSLATSALAYFTGESVRRLVQAMNSVCTSIPSLIVALAVGLVILGFNVLAFIGSGYKRSVVLAASALAVYPACTLSQILIEECVSVREKQYVVAARSAGFSETRVYWTVVFRNALLPWLAQLSNVAASLVAGSVIIEVVFSLPGLGRLILQSVLRADFPMVQGVVLVTSISFLVLNFAAELLYARLFPQSHDLRR